MERKMWIGALNLKICFKFTWGDIHTHLNHFTDINEKIYLVSGDVY